MPAPLSSRPHKPAKDLSAVPSFLRDARQQPAEASAPPAEGPARAKLAMPRPTTPSSTTKSRGPAPTIDPASLPMPSLSRRRVITAAGLLLAGLLSLTFARQVGDATEASNAAANLRAGNVALKDDVARLERDLGHVQDPRFILLEGRAFGLGGPREIPFALAAGAPPLAADAPGSASVRLGAPARPTSPLDAWLEVLFGAGS
jgi:hypothetical protein